MPSFGENSKKHLNTCSPSLKQVLHSAIKHYDFSVIWGFRDMKEQNEAFKAGNSTLRWPKSRHNSFPAEAFDVIPYPDGFEASEEEFYKMATYILVAASKLGVRLRWGGHWTKPKDMAHFELGR